MHWPQTCPLWTSRQASRDAVPLRFVFVTEALNLVWLHRQTQLRAVQSLDGCFLAHREDLRILRRVHIESENDQHLGFKLGVVGTLPLARPMGLNPVRTDRIRRCAARRRGDAAPYGGIIFPLPSPPGPVAKTREPRAGKTAPPLDDHWFGYAQHGLNLFIVPPLAASKTIRPRRTSVGRQKENGQCSPGLSVLRKLTRLGCSTSHAEHDTSTCKDKSAYLYCAPLRDATAPTTTRLADRCGGHEIGRPSWGYIASWQRKLSKPFELVQIKFNNRGDLTAWQVWGKRLLSWNPTQPRQTFRDIG